MIWLVDYSHYKKEIDPKLLECKKDYFRLKSYVRFKKIGETAPVGTKVYSTGLLRLATILDRNKIEVRYLHYYMLKEQLATTDKLPDKIAFSAICPTVPKCAELTEFIKQKFPNIKVLLGGVHVNLAHDLTKKKFPIFDSFITGYEYDAAEKIACRPLSITTDTYVDFSLLPYNLKDYAINTFTTMGCPFRCDYCVDGRAPHFCASKDGQINDLMRLLPPKTLVHFFDSVFGYSPDGIIEACKHLKKAKHEFLLSCDMRADLLTPAIVKELQTSGFVELRLGMESGDQNILDTNHRTLGVKRFVEQVKMIREFSDLYVTLYSITGIPGTDNYSQEKTLEFCDYLFSNKLVDEIKNALYVPYPISSVDYSDRGIRILSENWEDYDRQSFPVFETDKLSASELWNLYIHTAESINKSWLKSCSFSSFSEIPTTKGYYKEYIEENYMNGNEA